MKQKINSALNSPSDRHFQPFNDFLAVITLASVIAIVLETIPEMHRFHTAFLTIEYLAVVIFGLEYLARVYSAPSRLRYIFSFFGLVDLVAILPSVVHLANLTFLKSARVLRILRMLRMIRLAKLASLRRRHYVDAEHHVAIYRLNVQIYFAALAATLLLFGCAIYVVEAGHQGFQSIPQGIIWAADQVVGGGVTPHFPETTAGQIVTLLARFTGLVLLGVLLTVVNHMFKNILFGDKKAVRRIQRTRR